MQGHGLSSPSILCTFADQRVAESDNGAAMSHDGAETGIATTPLGNL